MNEFDRQISSHFFKGVDFEHSRPTKDYVNQRSSSNLDSGFQILDRTAVETVKIVQQSNVHSAELREAL